jgi:hypothetical protein
MGHQVITHQAMLAQEIVEWMTPPDGFQACGESERMPHHIHNCKAELLR